MQKEIKKKKCFQPLLFPFRVYCAHMNRGTPAQLERCAMYHCAPGVRRLHANFISIDRRWIRTRFCYFTPPLPPSPRPFVHDRQLDSDKRRKKGSWKDGRPVTSESGQDVLLGRFGGEGHRWPGRAGKSEEESQTRTGFLVADLPLPSGNRPLPEQRFPSERRRLLMAHLQLNFISSG